VRVVEGPGQVNHFLTGYAGPGSLVNQLTVPAIDPAGVAYGPSDHLFIVDSELDEDNVIDVWNDVGANVFEVSRDGSILHGSWDLPGMDPKREPTGIAYDAKAGVFYVTNDDTNRLYRYLFDSKTGFTLDDSVPTWVRGSADRISKDVEGVTVDAAGNIYVIDQKNTMIAVYTYGTGFAWVRNMPLVGFATVPETPEGIGYDAATGHLFVVSGRGATVVGGDDPAMFEYTTAGGYVDWYGLGHFSPLPTPGTNEHNLTQPEAVQGITFGPATSGASPTFYLADGGFDNGNGPVEEGVTIYERDGVIYEGRLP
jgi:DNA-binding beta-propeller fold protein YncE